MWLIIVEALAALAVLLLIVWWTMFHGRHKGEPPAERLGKPEDGDGPSS